MEFNDKKIWEPGNMAILFPNLCYNEILRKPVFRGLGTTKSDQRLCYLFIWKYNI